MIGADEFVDEEFGGVGCEDHLHSSADRDCREEVRHRADHGGLHVQFGCFDKDQRCVFRQRRQFEEDSEEAQCSFGEAHVGAGARFLGGHRCRR